MGYLLKGRVADVSDFIEVLRRVASGGTALDPELVAQLMGISRQAQSIAVLFPSRARGPRSDGRRAIQPQVLRRLHPGSAGKGHGHTRRRPGDLGHLSGALNVPA